MLFPAGHDSKIKGSPDGHVQVSVTLVIRPTPSQNMSNQGPAAPPSWRSGPRQIGSYLAPNTLYSHPLCTACVCTLMQGNRTCTLKKVVRHCVATALASNVLPVPEGPYSSTPFQGASKPTKQQWQGGVEAWNQKPGQLKAELLRSCVLKTEPMCMQGPHRQSWKQIGTWNIDAMQHKILCREGEECQSCHVAPCT